METVMQNARPSLAPGWPYALLANALMIGTALFGLLMLLNLGNIQQQGVHPVMVGLVLVFGAFLLSVSLHRLYIMHFASKVDAFRNSAMAARYPGQPWMLDPAWAKGRMVDTQIGRVVFLALFCVFWCGGIGFVVSQNFAEISTTLRAEPLHWLAAGFFALMTACALNVFLKMTRSWLRVGAGALVMDTLPGRIGGSFKARVETRLKAKPRASLQVDLTCKRKWHADRTASRPTRAPDEETLWWDMIKVTPAQMRKTKAGLVVPFEFALPADLPESGAEDYSSDIMWTVRITSVDGGDEFILYEWTVPVFRKGKRS